MLKIDVRPGDRPTASQWREMGQLAIRSQIRGTGGGRGTFASGPSGTVVSFPDTRRRAVFAIELNQDVGAIGVKEAIKTPAGWTVADGDEAIGFYTPWAGYDLAAFIPFLLADRDNVSEGEIACELDDDFLIPPTSVIPGFIGKCIAVNYPMMLCVVAPMKVTTDPTNKFHWRDTPGGFDLENAVCCWTGGWTGVLKGMACKVDMFRNSAIPIITPLYDITGENAERYCKPPGPFSPEGLPECEPVMDDVTTCDPRACCLPDGVCSDLPRAACDELGGTWFEEFECSDPEMEQSCGEPGPCCVNGGLPDCECHFVRPFECEALGGVMIEGDDCDSSGCCDPQPGVCCFEGSCFPELPAKECIAFGGTFIPGGTCDDCEGGP